MTNEEAVEEVLRGPFTDCVRCKGTGTRADGYMAETCQNCDGTGKWERGDYKQACVIVGIEPVRLPKPKTQYKGDAFTVSYWNRTLSLDEVAGLYSQGVQKAQQEARFKKEYMGDWVFNGVDDKIEFEGRDTVDALHYAITYPNVVKIDT